MAGFRSSRSGSILNLISLLTNPRRAAVGEVVAFFGRRIATYYGGKKLVSAVSKGVKGIEVEVKTPSAGAINAFFDAIRKGLGFEPRHPQFVNDLARIYALLLADGFHRGVDPYGRPWKPSIRVGKCGGKTLIQSGRLRRSIRATPVGNRIRLSASAPYAETHQKGAVIRPRGVGPLKFQICGQWFTKKTVTIPARPILPDRGLPRAWEAAAQDLLNRRSNRVRGIHVRP